MPGGSDTLPHSLTSPPQRDRRGLSTLSGREPFTPRGVSVPVSPYLLLHSYTHTSPPVRHSDVELQDRTTAPPVARVKRREPFDPPPAPPAVSDCRVRTSRE